MVTEKIQSNPLLSSMINDIETNIIFKINNIKNISEQYIKDFTTIFLKNDEYESLRKQYKDKETLRNTINSEYNMNLLMNLLFNIYHEYVIDLKNLKKDEYYKDNSQILLEQTNFLKNMNSKGFINKLMFYAKTQMNSLQFEYLFTILVHFYFTCSRTSILILKTKGLNWRNPFYKISLMLSGDTIINCKNNLLLSGSLHFLKSLLKQNILPLNAIFQVLDYLYDYENEQYLTKEIDNLELIDEVGKLLPNEIISNRNFSNILGCTLVGGGICINETYITVKMDEKTEEFLWSLSPDERLKEMIENHHLSTQVLKLSLIILHEMFHKKRKLMLSKGLYYKHSPKYDPNKVELDETGYYGERMLFGTKLNTKIMNINENLAKLLLDLKQWENIKTIQELITKIPNGGEVSTGCLSNDDYPDCFHAGTYDTYRKGKKKLN